MLAIAIGAGAAIFSVAEAGILRFLAHKDPPSLVLIADSEDLLASFALPAGYIPRTLRFQSRSGGRSTLRIGEI